MIAHSHVSKWTIVILLLSLSMQMEAQMRRELQLRSGFGFGIYKTTWDLQYHATNGTTSIDRDTSGAVTVQLPIELRYTFTKRITAGVDAKFGHYVYGDSIQANVTSRSNKLSVLGIAAEFNIVAKSNFRWYVGTGVNTSTLKINQTSKDSQGSLEENITVRGGGFRLNTGMLVYFKDSPVGFMWQIGYDGHSYDLKEYSRNRQSQDLQNVTGTLTAKGLDGMIGLVFRFKGLGTDMQGKLTPSTF